MDSLIFYLSGEVCRFIFKVLYILGHEREGYGKGGRKNRNPGCWKPKSGCNHSSFNYRMKSGKASDRDLEDQPPILTSRCTGETGRTENDSFEACI